MASDLEPEQRITVAVLPQAGMEPLVCYDATRSTIIENRLPDRVQDFMRAAALALATFTGPALASIAVAVDILLDGRAGGIVRQRVERFLEDLRAEFERLATTDWPHQYLQSQDFAHLVIVAVNAAAREKQREKIRLFARMLALAGDPSWVGNEHRVEASLRTLAETSQDDFAVLGAVIRWSREAPPRHPRRDVPDPFPGGDSTGKFEDRALLTLLPQFAPARMRPTLARLERLGLILELFGDRFPPDGGTYVVTPLLADLAELIGQPLGGEQRTSA